MVINIPIAETKIVPIGGRMANQPLAGCAACGRLLAIADAIAEPHSVRIKHLTL